MVLINCVEPAIKHSGLSWDRVKHSESQNLLAMGLVSLKGVGELIMINNLSQVVVMFGQPDGIVGVTGVCVAGVGVGPAVSRVSVQQTMRSPTTQYTQDLVVNNCHMTI